MTELIEEKLAHRFPANWHATKYDEWTYYTRQFNGCCNTGVRDEPGSKAVDFLAYEPGPGTLWLIELKDYRQWPRTKTISLPLEIAQKVRDTLAGIFATKVRSQHADAAFAQTFLGAHRFRVVLHLEQPQTHSRLFPRVYSRADVQQKLKQLIRSVDSHPSVVELASINQSPGPVPWTARSVP
jgi:hypothetical protein